MGRGEAGRIGDSIRSDLHVVVEDGAGDGIAIELSSKVDSWKAYLGFRAWLEAK